MIRSILFIGLFWLCMVRLSPALIYVTLFKKRMSREQIRAHGLNTSDGWSRTLLKVLQPRITIRGTDKTNPEEPILIVSNHQGEFDIPLLFHTVKRPFGFIAKKELRRVPLVGPWMAIIGCQFVDRTDVADAQALVQRAVDALQAGDSLAIFPEGTRTSDGQVAQLKPGFCAIARRGNASLLPVAIDGAYTAWPRHQVLPWPATINIEFGEPISPEQIGAFSDSELIAEVQRRIAACHLAASTAVRLATNSHPR